MFRDGLSFDIICSLEKIETKKFEAALQLGSCTSRLAWYCNVLLVTQVESVTQYYMLLKCF